jgi:SAM-dependent methyltransferase
VTVDSLPNDPVRATARAYDADAVSWHAAHRGEDRATARREGYDRFAALLPTGALVLDLGCGSGLDAAPLAARGLRLVGLDVSHAMLRIAQEEPQLSGRLLLAEMSRLPLADASVDAILADGTLHHLPKDALGAALREAARVLRSGGILSASVERGDFAGYVERQEGVAGPRWYAYYEPEELADAFTAAGLMEIDRFIGGRGEHTAGFVALSARKP